MSNGKGKKRFLIIEALLYVVFERRINFCLIYSIHYVLFVYYKYYVDGTSLRNLL